MSDCKWHEGDEPLGEDESPACPNCGQLLATTVCESCGEEFLDWEWRYADDVLASPCGDSHGDLCCSNCIASVEYELRQAEGEDDDWLDYEPDDVPRQDQQERQ